MREVILGSRIVKVNRFAYELLVGGFYGYVSLTKESLVFKYFLLGLPVRFPWSKKRGKIVGIMPKVFDIPLTQIQSVGKLHGAFDTLMVGYRNDGKNKTIYFRFWEQYLDRGPAELYEEWIQAIDSARTGKDIKRDAAEISK